MIDRKKILDRLPRAAGSWYAITNKAGDGGPAQIRIYEEIGFWGITEEDFARELDEVTADEIEVQISSPGGDVWAGIAIYNALRAHPARVTTRVDSLAASAASLIVQAGDRRVILSAGQLMIHNVWGIVIGDADDMRGMADLLEKQNTVVASIYAEHTDTAAEEWLELMATETWYTAEEAVDAGLADEVVKPAKQSKKNRGPDSPHDTRFQEQAASVVTEVEQLVARAEEVIAFRRGQGKPPLSDDSVETFDRLEAAHRRLADAVASDPASTPPTSDAEREFLRFVASTTGD
jgi:ATP-dependent Clp endopeptidase proteolytic subunit ClpP